MCTLNNQPNGVVPEHWWSHAQRSGEHRGEAHSSRVLIGFNDFKTKLGLHPIGQSIPSAPDCTCCW